VPTATSLPRSRMRFTLGECLAATVRGMALAALMANPFACVLAMASATIIGIGLIGCDPRSGPG
jgi:hypothetical protein